jgi:GNAT superfamily N-acetyltransferase
MSSAVRIREVDPLDVDVAEDIAEMHLVCFAYKPDVALTDFGYWWLGFDGQTPVCFAGMWPSQNWPNAGYLCRAGVMPKYRGQGLQRRLLLVREKKARALGWTMLVSDTHDNPPSSNNLIRAGHKMFTPPKPWGPDGSSYWKKELR